LLPKSLRLPLLMPWFRRTIQHSTFWLTSLGGLE
jgi:hypothetical protein